MIIADANAIHRAMLTSILIYLDLAKSLYARYTHDGVTNVQAFRDAHIAPGAEIHTDGLRAFTSFADACAKRVHKVTPTGSKRPQQARGSAFFWVNTAIANLSTAIKATYKAPSAKHLPDYLGAFCWTTNHRKNMPGMISAACRAIATSSAITRRKVYADMAGQIG
jgi:hypothetical protein